MPGSQLHADLTIRIAGREEVSAPTLVLMHGLTDSGACWPDAVRRWSPQYRLIAWDARGHGESARFLERQLEVGMGQTHLDDAISLLENLARHGTERPVLVGHSMGGGTAAAVAADRPDLVRAVLLEDPALGTGLDQVREADPAEGQRRVAEVRTIQAEPGTALDECRRDNPTWPESELEPWLEAKLQTDLVALANPLITVPTPATEIAGRISAPALVVTGTEGVIWTGAQLSALEAVENPYLNIAVLTGAGHCVRRSQPTAFHAVADPWLARQFP